VVWKVGAGVTSHRVGDEVVINGTSTCGDCDACRGPDPLSCEHVRAHGYETPYGTFAQFTLVHERQLLPKPTQLTWEEAASYPVALFTAYRMLRRADTKKGESVLIWGAAGGLGCFAIQLTLLLGGTPVAVVSSEEKARLARELGARIVLNRCDFPGLAYQAGESEDQRKRRLEATKAFGRAIARGLGEPPGHARGVDVVFEHVGQETLPASIFLAARMGRVVTCGATTGYDVTFDIRHLWMRQKSIIGSHGSNLEDGARANELMQQGKLRPVLTKLYPFSKIPLAHEEMQDNSKLGNVVCLVCAPRAGLKTLAEIYSGTAS
jgi:crotonyl-CoA carboxylase/reductase